MGNTFSPKTKKSRKPYDKPTVTKLTPEEVKLKVIDYAGRGDQARKTSLVTMFPEETKRIINK